MLRSLLNIFKVPDLRNKVFITLALIFVYRLGAHVPCPFVDLQRLDEMVSSFGGGKSLFSVVNMFSGGAFAKMTIFALGIMPYITASIILQLLTVVWPYLEKISKEGEAGRKKINQYTRYGTVLLALFQSVGLAAFMIQQGLNLQVWKPLFIFTIMVAMTTGTCFIMWLGEKITEHGIGNGISLIIAIGIIAGYRNSLGTGYNDIVHGQMAPIWMVLVPAVFVGSCVLIIIMQTANRKIPIQYARRQVGRREMQGGTNFLPLKINTAGVIPVIFASSILMFPSFFFKLFPAGSMISNFENVLSPATGLYNLYAILPFDKGGIFNILKMGNLYNLIYVVLCVFFCYFYTAITFNPIDTADNLKRVGAFIPGRRPGKQTSDYIDYVLTRITLVGAVYLVVVALLPNVLNVSAGISYAFADLVGGTGLIIVAGVLLDLMKQIESQLLMRHYEGFKYRSRTGSGASARAREASGPRGVSTTSGRTLSGGRGGRR